MNYINTLNGLQGLGELAPEQKQLIAKNSNVVDLILQKQKALEGLGDVSDKLTAKEVIAEYNKGITENEIKAWVWYKQKYENIPMTVWKDYFINDNDVIELVRQNAMFIEGEKFVPKPIFTFGNIYEKLNNLIADKNRIIETYGQEIYDNHYNILMSKKRPGLSLFDPNPKNRPIIQAISELAIDKDIFAITTVRSEYLSNIEDSQEVISTRKKDSDKAELVKIKGKKKIDINFDRNEPYSLADVFCKWLFSLSADTFKVSDADKIANVYVRGFQLKADKDTTEAERNAIKSNARNEGEELFQRFLSEVLTDDDKRRLDEQFNSKYNPFSDIDYLSVPVAFECSRRFGSGLLELKDIQKEGVSFIEMLGSGIIAYDVGVGKTMTGIIALANNIYTGKCKRPVIVVPDATYDNWKRELFGYTDNSGEFVPGILSYTDITLNDWYNLGVNIQKNIDLTKPVSEKSITLLTYYGFKQVGFSDKVAIELTDELEAILKENNDEKTDKKEGAKKRRDPSAREKEKEREGAEEKVGKALRNTICNIDTVGFDYIMIDEAHNFKNIFTSVGQNEQGRKLYNITSAYSDRGVSAFMICNYLQKIYGNSVILLTATPFTNSPLEIYSMLSLVGYTKFKQQNINNLNAFFNLFILPTYEWVVTKTGEVEHKQVIKGFINRVVLQNLIYNNITFCLGEDAVKKANIERPKKINLPLIYQKTEKGIERLGVNEQILTYLKPTDKQQKYQDFIKNWTNYEMEKIKKIQDDELKLALMQKIIFRSIAMSQDNAISPYMFAYNAIQKNIVFDDVATIDIGNYKEFVEDSPKINYVCQCVKSVKQWHDKAKQNPSADPIIQSVSGQVIYCNRAKEYFKYIKEWLEKEAGYKKGIKLTVVNEYGDKVNISFDEVEFIVGGDKGKKTKEIIKQAYQKGIVKVIIGTSAIKEGINLQKYGTVIYNLSVDWNPTDQQQLEGRIHRQGNEYAFVRSVIPLVQDSMDVFKFQKLEEKTARINELWSRSESGNVLAVESIDPAEMKLAIITDMNNLAILEYDKELKELLSQIKAIQKKIEKIDSIVENIQYYKERKTIFIDNLNDIHKQYIKIHEQALNYNIDNVSDDELKKKMIKLINKVKEFKQNFDNFINNNNKTDDEVLDFARKLSAHISNNYQAFGNGKNIDFPNIYKKDNYKSAIGVVNNIIAGILKPKGLTIDSDLSSLKSDYLKDLSQAEAKLILYDYKETKDNDVKESPKNSQRYQQILEDLNKRKALLNITGDNSTNRSQDFQKLNYLLGWLKGAIIKENILPSPDVNPIYPVQKPQQTIDKRKAIALAEAEAEAILLMLILQEDLQQVAGLNAIDLQTIINDFKDVEYDTDVFSKGGGLDNEKFVSVRQAAARNDKGKRTLGEVVALFKRATKLDTEFIRNVILFIYPLNYLEWHHSGKYKGKMSKTYFLNSKQIVDIANNWQKYLNDYILFNEQEQQKRINKQQTAFVKSEFLTKFGEYKNRLTNKPNYFITDKEEMYSKKFGFFPANNKYPLDIYYSGWQLSEDKYNEYWENF